MMRTPEEKSSSVPDMTAALNESTPPSFISARHKRKRDYEVSQAQVQDMTKDLKNEMKDLISGLAETQNAQINTILTTLKEIHQTTNLVQTTITHLSEENLELKTKIEKLETQARKDKEQIILLENKVEGMQRTERKTNIEIKNVPLKGDENKKDLLLMVTKLYKYLDLKLERSDVKDIIKTRKPKTEKSTLIVELNSTFAKTDLLKAAKTHNYKNKNNKLSAWSLGLAADADTPIFISENLTPLSSRLYFLARDFKSANKYKYCWTSYGKVYLRMDENTPIITVLSEAQLLQLPKQ
ncbi:Zinc finger DNA binding protein [Operophtera brumata]|uniref:Zinc finger DNA binding protein n=1 Tax=Operophtera brumata TaxID=104452 RepID=A0A0L7L1P7_OPEBR|nr:Zinc finger DNA binding protein [Operophtera brumata]